MRALFYHCNSLTSLDLSYFDISKVTNTWEMFSNCISLYSLNLANFNTSQVVEMLKMFSNCTKLIYINLENAELKKLKSSDLNKKGVFKQTSDSLVICSKDNKWNIGNSLSINCKNNSNNNKEYNCYTRESIISYNKYLCNTCGNNYYQIDNDEYNNNSNINCYESPEGYYLDENTTHFLYKPCYSTCKICNREGNIDNNNCIECKNEYYYEIQINNYKNCYDNCTYYHY